jgi:hypothetical protein
VVPVVPTPLINDYVPARAVSGIKIGGVPARLVGEVDAAGFLRRTRLPQPGAEVSALRQRCVQMFADDEGAERLAGSSAIKWLEAEVSIGAYRRRGP